jgi:spermidine synthase
LFSFNFKARDLSVPTRECSDEQCKTMGLKFYSKEMHRAAFVLPNFAKTALAETAQEKH